MAEFCYLMLTAGRHTFFWKWEDNQNKPFFQLHILKQLQTQSRPAPCHINTFTLTIPVSRLKAELITLPFRNSQHTNIITVTIFPTHIYTEIYSILFSTLQT